MQDPDPSGIPYYRSELIHGDSHRILSSVFLLTFQDTNITWESLDFQPEMTATASNIGFGWWSQDIGGHFGGYKARSNMAWSWTVN